MVMTTDPATYFADGCGRCPRFATGECSARRWSEGLATLRDLCRLEAVSETAKWGHPVYVAHGRNIAIIGAFRGDFRLSFFLPQLLQGHDGLLEKAGPNARHAGTLRFSSTQDVERHASAIRDLFRQAIGHAAAGRVPPKARHDDPMPEDLLDALDADPELADGWAALTPGRQRSWLIHLASAKTATTREARIVRARDAILAGLGAHDRS